MGRRRGTPRIWDEVKEIRLCVTITPTAKRLLDEIAELQELSLSEVIERYARNNALSKGIDPKKITFSRGSTLPLAKHSDSESTKISEDQIVEV